MSGLQLLPGSRVTPKVVAADTWDAAGRQCARGLLQDGVSGGAAVVDVDIAAEHRGTPFRVPDVLVPGKSTPDPGQLDWVPVVKMPSAIQPRPTLVLEL